MNIRSKVTIALLLFALLPSVVMVGLILQISGRFQQDV
jgi:hypothetical protein